MLYTFDLHHPLLTLRDNLSEKYIKLFVGLRPSNAQIDVLVASAKGRWPGEYVRTRLSRVAFENIFWLGGWYEQRDIYFNLHY